MTPQSGARALNLACYLQNEICDLEEIIELFCLDAEAARPVQPQRVPLTWGQIYDLWPGAFGAFCDDSAKFARAIEAAHGIVASEGGEV